MTTRTERIARGMPRVVSLVWRATMIALVGGTLLTPLVSGGPSVSASADLSAQLDRLREDAIAAVRPAVVEVDSLTVGVVRSIGSGCILTPDGYIVTNRHVVAGADSLRVTLDDGTALPARLVAEDPLADLAVIKVARRGLSTVTLGDAAALQVGQSVLAIGTSVGLGGTVTEGIVSARRTVDEGRQAGIITGAIQTSAAINLGNSGGALIALDGTVVGIPTLVALDREYGIPAYGVGFAIPASTVRAMALRLIGFDQAMPRGRAFLGMTDPVEVTPALAAHAGLAVDHGLQVTIVPHGPAWRAGLRSNVIVVTVGARRIASYRDLIDALAGHKPGDTIVVGVGGLTGRRLAYWVILTAWPG